MIESQETIQDLLKSSLYFNNDVYHKFWFNFDAKTDIPRVQVNFIFPATEDHIKKYSS